MTTIFIFSSLIELCDCQHFRENERHTNLLIYTIIESFSSNFLMSPFLSLSLSLSPRLTFMIIARGRIFLLISSQPEKITSEIENVFKKWKTCRVLWRLSLILLLVELQKNNDKKIIYWLINILNYWIFLEYFLTKIRNHKLSDQKSTYTSHCVSQP